MAYLSIDLKLTGTVENAVAERLFGQAEALRAACAEAGMELRGHGIDVVLDAVSAPVPEPDAVVAEPVVPEPVVDETPRPARKPKKHA